MLLVAAVLAVSTVGLVIGLWGRWRATLASKRVQVAVRRRVFEHAVRLPLHRVYQLKSGGASSLLREDAGGVGELIFSMLYNPWRAVVQLAGGLVVAGLGRLAAAAGGALPGARGDLLAPALEPPAPAALPRHPQASAGDRRQGGRGLRRHAGRPRLRPPAQRVGPVRGREPPDGPPGAVRLVVVAVRRGRLGAAAADGLGGAALLRRPAGARRPAHARRPDDVPGLPGHAPRAAGRAGDERHPVAEQPLRASTASSTSWPSRSRWPTAPAPSPSAKGRSPAAITFEDVSFAYPAHDEEGPPRRRPRRRAGRDRSPWSAAAARARRRSATSSPGSTTRPRGRSGSTASTCATSRSRATAACWGSSSRTSSSSTARSPRTSPTPPARRPPRRSSGPRGSPTPTSSSRPCPTATTPSSASAASSSAAASGSAWPSPAPCWPTR